MKLTAKGWFKYGLYSFIGIMIIVVTSGLFYVFRPNTGNLPVTGPTADFTATNIDNKLISFTNLNGKIRLVTFFYTHCPGPCPLTAYRLEQVQNQMKKKGIFGTKVDILSVTLDPEHDSLPVLRTWASHYHPDYQGWYFLRPNSEQLPQILQSWGIAKQVIPGTVYISHTIKTELIDQNGNVRAIYMGDNPNPNQILNDINSLLPRWNW